jgi:hypothetical protein
MKRFYSFATAGVLVLGISPGAYGQRNASGLPWRQENLVRLHATVAGARAVGVFAACDDKIAPEEYAFTVESVRYTINGSAAASTKFDAICIDIGFPEGGADDAWNCSPVTLEGFAVSVDAGAGGSVVANGGVNTGSTSAVGSNGQVTLGSGVALPLSSRLQVPMAQYASSNRPNVRLGGNILMESRIGSVSAGQTVVFGHTSFDGVVTFMVTRPASMTLSIGHVNAAGETKCNESSGDAVTCPAAFDRALRSACELSAGGPCSSAGGDAPAPTTAFGPAIDIDELRASLEKRQETISTVNSDLKEKLPDKITEVFELLDSDEDDEGTTAAARPGLRIFSKVKAHFQTKVLPKLQEIKEAVQEQVNCPH